MSYTPPSPDGNHHYLISYQFQLLTGVSGFGYRAYDGAPIRTAYELKPIIDGFAEQLGNGASLVVLNVICLSAPTNIVEGSCR
jgi:hypothetical protein